MQFKVPQDVQQADRIVAFLTLPQLIICVIGFAVSYGVYTALYNQGLPMIIWLPPIMIIGGLTLAFAFLKIANLPFHHYLALLIERFITPSKRVWVKGGDRVISDEVYVSSEDKKTGEKTKKMNELQQQKEEKMQSISEITDMLDTLKKEPVKETILEKIDQADDKELLKAAFLDEKKQPVKKEQTVEEKIVSLSQLPKIETPAQNVTTPKNQSEILADPEKKKRRRKRRRKKKSAETQPLPSGQSAPAAAPISTIEPTTPRKEIPTEQERAPKTEPAVPIRLKEEAPKAPAQKEPINQPQTEPHLTNSQPGLKSSPTEEVKTLTQEVKTPPAIPSTEKPKEAAVPGWLKKEAPKAPAPKEIKNQTQTPDLTNPQPVLKSSFDESSEAVVVRGGGAKEEGGRGAIATEEVKSPSEGGQRAIATEEVKTTSEGVRTEEVHTATPEVQETPAQGKATHTETPKKELKLEPPEIELELEPPEAELELEAPEIELELKAPEELELEAPEEELELQAPAQTKTTPISQLSTLNSQPSTPTPEKTIKSEEIFTADQLKQGQTIKIPKT